jgi:hypothetical protein
MEKTVKGLLIFSHLLVTLTFVFAWRQNEWAPFFGLESGFQLHLWMGLTGLFLSMFANLCIIFYFVGSGVWIKDRSKETYRVEEARGKKMWTLYEAANRLKGKGFPFATLCLVLGLFTFILGGARQVSAVPNWLHPTLATLWLLLSWAGVRPTFRAMDQNLKLLDEVSDLMENVALNH